MGVWIEIRFIVNSVDSKAVTPCMGVWIEIIKLFACWFV